MAEIIHCRCGRAMECRRTDVLETVVCPACRTELALDLSINGDRRRGYLTVVAGPERVGEVVLIPVDVELAIGSASASWLYLPDASVSDHHCTIRLRPDGVLALLAAGSEHGDASSPWAEVKSNQGMRIGAFVLKFAVRDVEMEPAAGRPPVRTGPPPPPPMVVMRSVTSRSGWPDALASHRFRIARAGLIAAALLLAALHGVSEARKQVPDWGTLVAMTALVAGMFATVRKIGVGQRLANLLASGLVIAAAGVELITGHLLPGIGLLILPAGMLLATEQPRQPIWAFVALLLVVVGVAVLAFALLGPRGPLFGV